MQLLAGMQQKDSGPHAIIYPAAISAGEIGEQPHKASVLLAEMHQIGVALNAVMHSAAISACMKAKQPRKVLELLFFVMQRKAWDQTPSHTALLSCMWNGQAV